MYDSSIHVSTSIEDRSTHRFSQYSQEQKNDSSTDTLSKGNISLRNRQHELATDSRRHQMESTHPTQDPDPERLFTLLERLGDEPFPLALQDLKQLRVLLNCRLQLKDFPYKNLIRTLRICSSI